MTQPKLNEYKVSWQRIYECEVTVLAASEMDAMEKAPDQMESGFSQTFIEDDYYSVEQL